MGADGRLGTHERGTDFVQLVTQNDGENKIDWYLRRSLAYEASVDPATRVLLTKSQMIGGALCELPMAMGVVQLFFGGETRWFLGATLITIALRLSFRPFTREARS